MFVRSDYVTGTIRRVFFCLNKIRLQAPQSTADVREFWVDLAFAYKLHITAEYPQEDEYNNKHLLYLPLYPSPRVVYSRRALFNYPEFMRGHV